MNKGLSQTNTISRPKHIPVLISEVIEALAPRDNGIYLDTTLGAGGYSRALLEAAKCKVCAIDRDPVAIANASDLVTKFSGRLITLEGRFSDMETLLSSHGIYEVDGIAFDLGISSMQLDTANRGFSFRYDAALDMRMETEGPTAREIINTSAEEILADLIYDYGEERRARAIARAIVIARKKSPINRTAQLADIVRQVVRHKNSGIDPATRTFQALRIYINDELKQLDLGLAASERLLRPGGRLAVVSFHSLEDKKVKSFLGGLSGDTPNPSRHQPSIVTKKPQPSFRLLYKGAKIPTAAECSRNPRSRSAKLRAAERTVAPPIFGKDSND